MTYIVLGFALAFGGVELSKYLAWRRERKDRPDV